MNILKITRYTVFCKILQPILLQCLQPRYVQKKHENVYMRYWYLYPVVKVIAGHTVPSGLYYYYYTVGKGSSWYKTHNYSILVFYAYMATRPRARACIFHVSCYIYYIINVNILWSEHFLMIGKEWSKTYPNRFPWQPKVVGMWWFT